MPPATMLDSESFDAPTFIPAPELETWLRSTFIEEGAPLQNDGHFHLRLAQIGVLWTSIENARNGRRVVAKRSAAGRTPWANGLSLARNFRSWNGSGESRISS